MKKQNRRKKRSASFNPNREYVSSAVREYLKKGGKITQLKAENDNFEVYMSTKTKSNAADDFLADNGNY